MVLMVKVNPRLRQPWKGVLWKVLLGVTMQVDWVAPALLVVVVFSEVVGLVAPLAFGWLTLEAPVEAAWEHLWGPAVAVEVVMLSAVVVVQVPAWVGLLVVALEAPAALA